MPHTIALIIGNAGSILNIRNKELYLGENANGRPSYCASNAMPAPSGFFLYCGRKSSDLEDSYLSAREVLLNGSSAYRVRFCAFSGNPCPCLVFGA